MRRPKEGQLLPGRRNIPHVTIFRPSEVLVWNKRLPPCGKDKYMTELALVAPMFAAAGYSLLYLLLGGGLGGAVLIFIVAKALGK